MSRVSVISITFRRPVVDLSSDREGPYVNFLADDGTAPQQWHGCGHRHKSKAAALKCARSLAMGSAWRIGERVEIRSKEPSNG